MSLGLKTKTMCFQLCYLVSLQNNGNYSLVIITALANPALWWQASKLNLSSLRLFKVTVLTIAITSIYQLLLILTWKSYNFLELSFFLIKRLVISFLGLEESHLFIIHLVYKSIQLRNAKSNKTFEELRFLKRNMLLAEFLGQ